MNKSSHIVYNTVVIGGGVAGLSAAYILSKDERRVLVIDHGPQLYQRSRECPYDIANGIGGAGLYSDGKLSFPPSATNLWTLDKDALRSAYCSFQDFLSQFRVIVPDFTEEILKPIEFKPVLHKQYDSLLLSLEQRMQIVYAMAMEIGSPNILTQTSVTKLSKKDGYYHISIETNGEKRLVVAESIILAGGKYCFDYIRKISENITLDDLQERYEIGIRVECKNEDFDKFDDEQIDVKIIDKSRENHIRTFCCSRNGIVVRSRSYEYESYNGSSGEQHNTGNSNIGILIAIPKIDALDMRNKYSNVADDSWRMSLHNFMQEGELVYTTEIDNLLREFLQTHFPKMCSADNAILYYPSFERFGTYPRLSKTLRYGDENIWVVGDATGVFRGMMPAFVSGFLAAIVSRQVVNDNELFSKFHIKPSSTKPCKTVFTAQSKQTFYCRDAVCQFVFQQGAIPVNPFRVFDYFLGDRVNRDLVRNGNNELIRRCDELWVFGLVSDGVLFEIATCRQTGKRIRYFTISANADEIREITPKEVSFEPEVHKYQIKRGDLVKFLMYGDSSDDNIKQLSLFA